MPRMSPKKMAANRTYDTQGMDPEMRKTLEGEQARRDTVVKVTKPYRPPWGWGLFDRKPKLKKTGKTKPPFKPGYAP